MNKNWKLKRLHGGTTKKHVPPTFMSSTNPDGGYALFAYKGIVIERRGGSWRVARQIKLSGFPAHYLKMMEGDFNSGTVLKNHLEVAFLEVDPERHKELREKVNNWQCPHCRERRLLERKFIVPVTYKVRGKFGELNDEISTLRQIECSYCGRDVPEADITIVGDEAMV